MKRASIYAVTALFALSTSAYAGEGKKKSVTGQVVDINDQTMTVKDGDKLVEVQHDSKTKKPKTEIKPENTVNVIYKKTPQGLKAKEIDDKSAPSAKAGQSALSDAKSESPNMSDSEH